jgi:hypothetical protein
MMEQPEVATALQLLVRWPHAMRSALNDDGLLDHRVDCTQLPLGGDEFKTSSWESHPTTWDSHRWVTHATDPAHNQGCGG